jgi:hypothetical protein
MNENKRDLNAMFPKFQSEQYVNVTINFVDTDRNVFDAISQDGMRFIEKCQYLSVNPDGSGKIHHPSAGDTAVVKISSDGNYCEKIYSICAVDEDGVPVRDLGSNSKFMPGDKVWLAKGGAFLALLRNGLTKIGTSPLCQMIFMKLENYTRWISRNIEVQASGFRFYSVNDEGTNVTRLSIFLEDAFKPELRDKTSEISDFEIVVKEQALTIMTGPKDPDTGLRINRTVVTLVNDGSLLLFQSDELNRPTARLSWTPDGDFTHTIYDENAEMDGNKVIMPGAEIYTREVTRTKTNSAPFICVKEWINGNYDLRAEGHIGITSGQDILVNGKNVFSVAELTHSVEATGILTESKFNA